MRTCLLFLIIGSISAILCSCGKKKKAQVAPQKPQEDEEMVYYYLAREDFEYERGRLEGNRPPTGFSGRWKRTDHSGETLVENNAVMVRRSLRVSADLDTFPNGPFAGYLDERGNIGKSGNTLYISFYQKILDPEEAKSGVVQLLKDLGDGRVTSELTFGVNDRPGPERKFGLRMKKDPKLIILAPEPINDRENLIVLKIQFGIDDKDRVSFYYNPTVQDEKLPVETMTVEDLSFNSFGLSCFRDTEMRIRLVRFADTFEAVAIDVIQ